MKRGHVTGTRAQRARASDWYKKIELATLVRIEAEWLKSNTTPQEAPSDPTQVAGSTDQDTGRSTIDTHA